MLGIKRPFDPQDARGRACFPNTRREREEDGSVLAMPTSMIVDVWDNVSLFCSLQDLLFLSATCSGWNALAEERFLPVRVERIFGKTATFLKDKMMPPGGESPHHTQ